MIININELKEPQKFVPFAWYCVDSKCGCVNGFTYKDGTHYYKGKKLLYFLSHDYNKETSFVVVEKDEEKGGE